jgi:RimJ/RimL family protein N-acetyltransferase
LLTLYTDRLKLVYSNIDLAQAEINDRPGFSSILAAEVPQEWPPRLNDENSMSWNLQFLKNAAVDSGWSMWYFLLKGPEKSFIAIDNGGFKGVPDKDGTVEIGYSIIEKYHRNGFAPEAVTALINWAFAHEAVKRIIAHTLPELRPSIRVLEKCGFQFKGAGLEEGAIMFEKKKAF